MKTKVTCFFCFPAFTNTPTLMAIVKPEVNDYVFIFLYFLLTQTALFSETLTRLQPCGEGPVRVAVPSQRSCCFGDRRLRLFGCEVVLLCSAEALLGHRYHKNSQSTLTTLH